MGSGNSSNQRGGAVDSLGSDIPPGPPAYRDDQLDSADSDSERERSDGIVLPSSDGGVGKQQQQQPAILADDSLEEMSIGDLSLNATQARHQSKSGGGGGVPAVVGGAAADGWLSTDVEDLSLSADNIFSLKDKKAGGAGASSSSKRGTGTSVALSLDSSSEGTAGSLPVLDAGLDIRVGGSSIDEDDSDSDDEFDHPLPSSTGLRASGGGRRYGGDKTSGARVATTDNESLRNADSLIGGNGTRVSSSSSSSFSSSSPTPGAVSVIHAASPPPSS